MAYFIPSYIQKRLLKYALSRLEILDVDALDLSNLDIAWGSKSTVELRNIGLQNQKLELLLQLPPQLRVVHTSVAVVRLTVPADLHTSSIVIDIERIAATIKLEIFQDLPSPKFSQYYATTEPSINNERLTTAQRDLASNDLPSVQDLARSFLEQESAEEKEKLEARVVAQSIDLHQSVSSNTNEDEASAGTGVGLTLPTFLGSFLKSVGDRLQVNVKDVLITLEMDDTDGSPSHPTAFCIKLDAVHVKDGQSFVRRQEELSNFMKQDPSSIRGGRLIHLLNISAWVRMDKEKLVRGSQILERSHVDKEAQSPTHAWSSDVTAPSVADEDEKHVPIASPVTSTKGFRETSVLAESIGSLDSRFVDAEERDSLSSRKGLVPHDSLESQLEHHPPEQSSGSFLNTSGINSTGSYSDKRMAHRYHQQSSSIGTSDLVSGRSHDFVLDHGETVDPVQATVNFGSDNPLEFDSAISRPLGSQAEDHSSLLESRLFSHVDAESIYLSVADASIEHQSEDFHVPGSWSDNDSLGEAETHDPKQYVLPVGRDDLINTLQPHVEDSVASSTPPVVGTAKKINTLPSSVFTSSGEAPSTGSTTNTIETTLFTIDKIDILLADPHAQYPTQAAATSEYQDHLNMSSMSGSATSRSSLNIIPGAFSSYADLTSRRRSNVTESSVDEREKGARDKGPKGASAEPSTVPIKLYLGRFSSTIDISAVPSLLQLARKVLGILRVPEPSRTGTYGKHQGTELIEPANVSISFETLILSVLGNDAASDPRNDFASRTHSAQDADTTLVKALFQIKLAECSMIWSRKHLSSDGKLEIGCATCDIAGRPLFYFDHKETLSSPTRVDRKPIKDISITCRKVRNTPEINLVTLPIIVDLDFHKLDETLGSFGGFSGLIELGSSIVSDTDATPSAAIHQERPKAVHFETELKSVMEQPQNGSLRINARINGGSLRLTGREISIQYRSSAIKMVFRDSIVGLQIDEIDLNAPSIIGQRSEVELSMRNFGLKFLTRPEERDLSRLISLLTPSKDKFEEEDDFLLDTLMMQRKKGAAIRLNLSEVVFTCNDLATIQTIKDFAVELTKLSVAKYLPEESRPGLLTLGLISKARLQVPGIPGLEFLHADLKNIDFAHVGAPALIAVGLQTFTLKSEDDENLVKDVLSSFDPFQPPMFMARMIGDELEPTVKIKLWNVAFEYSPRLVEALLDVHKSDTQTNIAADMTASLAILTNRNMVSSSKLAGTEIKPLKLEVSLRDCALALNPRDLPSRALLIATNARLSCDFPKDEDFRASFDLRKAALLLVDDTEKLKDFDLRRREIAASRQSSKDQLSELCSQGYVSLSWISVATFNFHLTRSKQSEPDILDIDVGDELLVIESCADSTATLGELLNALSPQLPPLKGDKYRTEVASMQDMIASFTGDAFAIQPENRSGSFDDTRRSNTVVEDAFATSPGIDDQFSFSDNDSILITPDDMIEHSELMQSSDTILHPRNVSDPPRMEILDSDLFSGGVALTSLPPQISLFAKKWDSANNKYVHLDPSELAKSPIRARLRNVHIIWNLYDGYDWEKTRDTISKAVHDMQTKAEERRISRTINHETEEDDESVIGDFLFNSIYIGIPANHDPKDLAQNINHDMDEVMTETESHTSTTSPLRPSPTNRPPHSQSRKLKLQRSRRHKIAFELRGVSADFFVFSPNSETQSSLDVRIEELEIYDHVPTSTWKKFLTYMHDAGAREDKKPMIHLELCEVRPIPELTASELVLRVTVLPVRLHVDQDALDFMTRFFEFDNPPSTSHPPLLTAKTAQPYLQRVEVRPVSLKLDYKPKRVDYAGIRSGRTNEFKNFFVLDGAEMVLKHAIIYGTSGFNKLHYSLEDVWMPDILLNQLPSVLSGLNGVRTLVNVGSGMRDLVVVPIREYKKDGRIVRSISKGALAFARSTGGELTRFGAKLAVTAQTALQGAEDFLSSAQQVHSSPGTDRDWEDISLDDSEKRVISHYADQPAGLLQGLRGAARSLERDLLLTRNVIVAISGEVRESESTGGAARVLARHAPTLILRPMIGASKAIGQTLMGANNSVDPANRKRVEDKYKRS